LPLADTVDSIVDVCDNRDPARLRARTHSDERHLRWRSELRHELRHVVTWSSHLPSMSRVQTSVHSFCSYRIHDCVVFI